MPIPPAYLGREQTYLKHCVLREYLTKWGYKLGSTSKFGPRRLWYVDCFAGPWATKDENRDDTSVSIALRVLNTVQDAWREQGCHLSTHAVFVEANPKSCAELERHVSEARGSVEAHVLSGTFGDNVEAIQGYIGSDAAFVFVDPTGWKGVGMDHIARLVDRNFRDVMINVMYHHINRFKAEQKRAWLREQLSQFFGIEDNAQLQALDETGLLETYRRSLKERGQLAYALDLSVPHPTRDQTFFNLVVGGRHPDVVSLFREVEHKIIGDLAGAVRAEAMQAQEERATRQASFSFGSVPGPDRRYERSHEDGMSLARAEIVEALANGARRYDTIWPAVLELAHITKSDIDRLVVQMRDSNDLLVEGWKSRQRKPDAKNILSLTARNLRL